MSDDIRVNVSDSNKAPIQYMITGLAIPMIVLTIAFLAGFATGQDNPKPGTTITPKIVEKLSSYEQLTSPLPEPRSEPSKPGNIVAIARKNSTVAIPETNVSITYTEYTRGDTSFWLCTAMEGTTIKQINFNRWDQLDSVKVTVLGPIDADHFEFEIEP